MKTIKMFAVLAAVTMFSGAAHAGVRSVLRSVTGGLSKAVKGVKSAPGKVGTGIKTGWDAVRVNVGIPVENALKSIPTGIKTGWDATRVNVGIPVENALKGIPTGIKTGWHATRVNVGITVEKAAKKAFSGVKKLFGR